MTASYETIHIEHMYMCRCGGQGIVCVEYTCEHSVKTNGVCLCKLFNYLPREASTCATHDNPHTSTNVHSHTLPNAGHALRFESAIAPHDLRTSFGEGSLHAFPRLCEGLAFGVVRLSP